MTGCEMIKCRLWNGKNCSDTEPIFGRVCRLNDFWESARGVEILEEYESLTKGCDLSCFNHTNEPNYCKIECDVRNRIEELIGESEVK